MEISEVELIRKIRELSAPSGRKALVGIGDDAAVVEGRRGYFYLFTTDTLVEDVHFRWKYTSPRQLGCKALAVNISDVAAMGGYPTFALVSVGIPSSVCFSTVEQVYRGMLDLSSRIEVQISGGDTVRSPVFFISIALLGEVEEGKAILRSGARPRDSIYVTGNIGEAGAGLFSVQENIALSSSQQKLKQRLLSPFPRVKEAREILSRGCARAMIDLSDGLSSDLSHILQESKVGAKIWEDKFPISREVKAFCQKVGKSSLDFALQGGEDYELLFTAPPDTGVEDKLSFPVTRIGEIVEEPGLFLVDKQGEKKRITPGGWDHFKNSMSNCEKKQKEVE